MLGVKFILSPPLAAPTYLPYRILYSVPPIGAHSRVQIICPSSGKSDIPFHALTRTHPSPLTWRIDPDSTAHAGEGLAGRRPGAGPPLRKPWRGPAVTLRSTSFGTAAGLSTKPQRGGPTDGSKAGPKGALAGLRWAACGLQSYVHCDLKDPAWGSPGLYLHFAEFLRTRPSVQRSATASSDAGADTALSGPAFRDYISCTCSTAKPGRRVLSKHPATATG